MQRSLYLGGTVDEVIGETRLMKTMVYIGISQREVSLVIIRFELHTMIDCIIENKYLVYFVFVIMNNGLYIIQLTDLLLLSTLFSFFYHVLGTTHQKHAMNRFLEHISMIDIRE